MPLSTESLRTTVFLDGGNVFSTYADHQENFSLNKLRYSTGIEESWRSPIGPIQFSLAAPLNDKSGDELEYFQFLIGATF
ncbi:MAG: surface antigen [Gammaproteobacteria bacterium]|nr:surface antigen [Gammaproteobacteria bacterium]